MMFFDDILRTSWIASVNGELNIVSMHHTKSGEFMKYVVGIAAGAALALSIATSAVAGMATESHEYLVKQKACKKEASAQGLHLSKRRAFVKECMSKS
jgi:hypothetical protein